MTSARLAAALAALSLSACVSGPRSKVVHLAPPPVEVAPAPLPVTVGLHAPPDTTAAWWGAYLGGPIVPIGADAVDLVRTTLEKELGRLPPVPTPPPFSGEPPPADLVLVPTVDDFATFSGSEPLADWHAVSLRLALFDVRGGLVSSWTVRGAQPLPPPAPPVERADPQAEREYPAPPDGVAHAGVNLAAAVRALAAGLPADARLEAWQAARLAGGPRPLEALRVEVAHADAQVDYPGTKPTLFENGLVAIRVRIANDGPGPVRITGLHAQLRLPDGRVIQRVGPALALSRLGFASSLARVARIQAMGPLFGGISASADGFRELGARDTVRAQLQALRLEPAEVAPGGSHEGVLLFLPQVGGPAGGQATLELWAVTSDLRQLRVDRPVALPAAPVATELRGE